MKLAGTYRFGIPAQEVYDRLLDPTLLRSCMPGCERLEEISDGRFELEFSAPIPAITGRYEGTVDILDREPPRSFRMKIDATGKSGFVNADAGLRIEPDGDGSILHYDADAQIGGAAAGVGQRVITGVSRRQVEQMMRCIERQKLGVFARFVAWLFRVFGGRGKAAAGS